MELDATDVDVGAPDVVGVDDAGVVVDGAEVAVTAGGTDEVSTVSAGSESPGAATLETLVAQADSRSTKSGVVTPQERRPGAARRGVDRRIRVRVIRVRVI